MKRLLKGLRLLASTRAFLREGRRTQGYGVLDFVHGYAYARWPYLYIGVGTGEHRLVKKAQPLLNLLLRISAHNPADRPKVDTAGLRQDRGRKGDRRRSVSFADTYHGKVVPLSAATKLVSVRRSVSLTDLDRVIPYARARDLILNHGGRIVLLECPCRSARKNPCLPLDVCLILGEPIASFVAEHHPHRSRWIGSEEAVAVLQAAESRGQVHHAFFKEAMLGRFYAICNCCACCCGAMQAKRNGIPMLASSGYVSRVDLDVCNGCGTCADICQFGAVSLEGSEASVDPVKCMGCGLCASHCPQTAMALVRDGARSMPLELDELIEGA